MTILTPFSDLVVSMTFLRLLVCMHHAVRRPLVMNWTISEPEHIWCHLSYSHLLLLY